MTPPWGSAASVLRVWPPSMSAESSLKFPSRFPEMNEHKVFPRICRICSFRLIGSSTHPLQWSEKQMVQKTNGWNNGNCSQDHLCKSSNLRSNPWGFVLLDHDCPWLYLVGRKDQTQKHRSYQNNLMMVPLNEWINDKVNYYYELMNYQTSGVSCTVIVELPG